MKKFFFEGSVFIWTWSGMLSHTQTLQDLSEVGQLPCSGFITTFFSQNPLYSFLGYCGQKSTQKQCFGAF